MSQHTETAHEKWQAICIGLGAAIAVVFTSAKIGAYHDLVETTWFTLPGWLHYHHVNLLFVATELGMAFFFFHAGGGVRQGFMKGGPLSGPGAWKMPIVATAGGVILPGFLFYALAKWFTESLSSGWVVPTATDIAFASVVATLVFKRGHPAVSFLMTLAVMDDGAGLVLIPVVYSGGVNWLHFAAVIIGAVGVARAMRKIGITSVTAYFVVVGIPSWVAFLWVGVHTAMAFVPMALAMPAISPQEVNERTVTQDTLGRALNKLMPVMAPILLLFALTNAGINVTSFGDASLIVAGSLFFGKIFGIVLFVNIAMFFGLKLPKGMIRQDVWMVGAVASIGFTVSLFVSNIAFTGTVAQQASLGALISLLTGAAAAFTFKWAFSRRRAEDPVSVDEVEEANPAFI